jgi:hypothetical protein
VLSAPGSPLAALANAGCSSFPLSVRYPRGLIAVVIGRRYTPDARCGRRAVDPTARYQEGGSGIHSGAEGVGVDTRGNVYGGVVRRRMLERHRKR